MAALPEVPSHLHAQLSSRAGPRRFRDPGVPYLVGPHAIAAGPALEPHGTAPDRRGMSVTAGSILEAVLLSGESHRPGASPGSYLIVIDAESAMDHLEVGIRSLRRVNPDGRLNSPVPPFGGKRLPPGHVVGGG